MTDKKQIVVSKEDAVFRMDENGFWKNEHGRFEHPKIIKYFNASIRKDDNGYYVYQTTDEFEEKVYFPFEETAVFVVDVKLSSGVQLLLNIGTVISLDSGTLSTKNDALYLHTPEHLIKFSSQALLKLSKFMLDDEGEMVLKIQDKIYPVLDEPG